MAPLKDFCPLERGRESERTEREKEREREREKKKRKGKEEKRMSQDKMRVKMGSKLETTY